METDKTKESFVCVKIGKNDPSVLHLTPGSPDTSCLGQASAGGQVLASPAWEYGEPCKGENCAIRFLNHWKCNNIEIAES